MTTTTLNLLRKGQRARIERVAGDDTLALRLLEMGLIEGEAISLVGVAPMGDPLEFEVQGYHLSLRKSEALRVHVTVVEGTA